MHQIQTFNGVVTSGTALNTYLFDTCGYVRHEGYFSPQKVVALKALLQDYWPETRSDGTRRILSLIDISDELRQLATELAKDLQLYSYINQPFRLTESYALHRTPRSVQPLHNGFSEPNTSAWGTSSKAMWRYHAYHDGKLYCMMVKVLVYLTDILTIDDGPFFFIEGSHKANYRLPLPQNEIKEGIVPISLPSLRSILTRAGDVTVINEALAHGTYSKESPDPRIVMAFSYAPSFVMDYRRLSDAAGNDIWTAGFCE